MATKAKTESIVWGTMRVPGRSYADAHRFGKLTWVLEGRNEIYPDSPNEDVIRVIKLICKRIEGYDPQQDYVLLSGDPAAIAMITMCISRRHGKMRLLKWDNGVSRYYEIVVDVN